VVANTVALRRARGGELPIVKWPLTESQTLFALFSVAYLATACYLALIANVIERDTFSRVEIADRVLFSRDPHLAAIGFVWSPLPILALLPLMPLKLLWPQLVTRGLAGGIVSAACMAGSVVQLRSALRESGVAQRIALLLTAAFALHPLVFFFRRQRHD
jgi:hypothetical protein